MKKQPMGLDYQGRHPEAAHAASEEGMDTPAQRRLRELSPAGAVILIPLLTLGAVVVLGLVVRYWL